MKSILVFSQDKGYVATYSYDFIISEELLNRNNKTDTDRHLLNLYQTTKKGAEHIEIRLYILNTESYSYITPVMDIDNLSLKTAIVASGYKQPVYTNNKTEEVLTKNSESIFQKDSYIINHLSLKTQWKLLKDQKNCNGYLCYKATAMLSKNINGKKKDFNIVAWYAPTIPVSFGPYGYGKLPGLIVELTVLDKKYTLESFKEIPSEDVEIIKPIKGECVTNEEYQELVKKAVKGKI
tara:strand:- start:7917 stop:8627 length:711 start_codon:yes stop_codon:yes gene_type:complete